MRYVIVLLIGALIGSMLTMITLNSLRQARAVPDGVMAVMGYQMNLLRTDITAERCDAAAPHFQTLLGVAGAIEPVFLPSGGDDVLFKRYAEQLRSRLDEALKVNTTDCRTLTEQVGRVGDGCKACHRDFKN
ncbi:MAG: hypothetical protein ACT4NL_10215 [Pseudomarimonas sp.]